MMIKNFYPTLSNSEPAVGRDRNLSLTSSVEQIESVQSTDVFTCVGGDLLMKCFCESRQLVPVLVSIIALFTQTNKLQSLQTNHK